jgi:hypothetical protein
MPPVLLFGIGLTMEQWKDVEIALLYTVKGVQESGGLDPDKKADNIRRLRALISTIRKECRRHQEGKGAGNA